LPAADETNRIASINGASSGRRRCCRWRRVQQTSKLGMRSPEFSGDLCLP
jgi:hypothetical protein